MRYHGVKTEKLWDVGDEPHGGLGGGLQQTSKMVTRNLIQVKRGRNVRGSHSYQREVKKGGVKPGIRTEKPGAKKKGGKEGRWGKKKTLVEKKWVAETRNGVTLKKKSGGKGEV